MKCKLINVILFRFSKSGPRIKLWQLLVAIAAMSVGLALLPERIGVPILFGIEAMFIIVFLFVVLRKLVKK